jgi:hypothetical protein
VWFLQVNEPNQTFETLADPGLERFHNLGSMLSVALQSKIKGGDLERELNILLSNMIKDQKLISGRQVTHMICRGLRLDEKMSTVYSITDLCNVKWAGDSYEKISLFKSHWDNVVQNLPSLPDDLLCEMLVTQMKQSKEFAMGVKEYYRDAANRNYQFLIGAISQHLALAQMERNRQSQIAILGGAPTQNVGKANAAGKGNDNKSNSGGKNQAPTNDTTKLPCFAFQTGECRYGNECKYGHHKISKEEFEGIKRKRDEAISQKAGNTKERKERRERAQDLAPLRQDQRVLMRIRCVGRGVPAVLALGWRADSIVLLNIPHRRIRLSLSGRRSRMKGHKIPLPRVRHCLMRLLPL